MSHRPSQGALSSLATLHSDVIVPPLSAPRHVVAGMLVANYMTSVVPLHCYQFLYVRVSSNFPFYLLVLLVGRVL